MDENIDYLEFRAQQRSAAAPGARGTQPRLQGPQLPPVPHPVENAYTTVTEWMDEYDKQVSRKLRNGVVEREEVARLGALILCHLQNKYNHAQTEDLRPLVNAMLSPVEYDMRYDGHPTSATGDPTTGSSTSAVYDAVRNSLFASPEPADTPFAPSYEQMDPSFSTTFLKFDLQQELAEIAFAALREATRTRPNPNYRPGSGWYTADEDTVTTSPVEQGSVTDMLAGLDAMTGLDSVKTVVRQELALIRQAEQRKIQGLKVTQPNRHMIFTGNPGTGKTSVARIIAGIYRSLGLLDNDFVVEVDASGLVSVWNSGTHGKTNRAINAALGGVLFIDEAYSLVTERGQEAINTLVKRMEDDRDDLVVILAGYPDDMRRLLDSNPGLSSRIGLHIDFPDYSDPELVTIFESLVCGDDFLVEPRVLQGLEQQLATTPRPADFGNGRVMRNLFDLAVRYQAMRLYGGNLDAEPTKQDQLLLSHADLECALRDCLPKSETKNVGFGV